MTSSRSIGTLCMTVALLVACNRQSIGREINVVSPSEAADVEGDDSLHAGPAGHLQMLFPASDFLSLPGSHRTITAIAWRQDESTALTEPITGTGPWRVFLSTTDADELTSNFEVNHGDDKTLVFDGGIVWQTDDTGPGPREFDFVFPLDTPFTYDPSAGRNLILDFIPTVAADHVDDWFLDRQTTNAITSQADRDPSAPIAGFPRSTVMVTQFTFVPEPSTFVSAAFAAVWFLVRRRNLRFAASRQ